MHASVVHEHCRQRTSCSRSDLPPVETPHKPHFAGPGGMVENLQCHQSNIRSLTGEPGFTLFGGHCWRRRGHRRLHFNPASTFHLFDEGTITIILFSIPNVRSPASLFDGYYEVIVES